MDELYFNAELERLAVLEPPEFGQYQSDYSRGKLSLHGDMQVDNEYFDWEYVHPNVYKPTTKALWRVTDQDGKVVTSDVRRRSWDFFMNNVLPDIVVAMSKRYKFPMQYLESIPAMEDKLREFKIDKGPDEDISQLLEWEDWVKKPGVNSREGTFTYQDPMTKEQHKYRFRYEEHFAPTGDGKWHYTKVKCSWIDKPAHMPKRQREDYLRIIKGEIATQATEEAERIGIMETTEEQTPKGKEAPPMPEAEEPEGIPAAETGGIQVAFTSEWNWPKGVGYWQIDGTANKDVFHVTVLINPKDQAKYDSPSQTNIAISWDSIAESDEEKLKPYNDAVRKAVMKSIEAEKKAGEAEEAAAI